MPLTLIPFLLLVVPITEITLFVLIGGEIGVLATIALVLTTAVTGTILLRIQGFGIVNRIRRMLDEGRMPGRELVHGLMIMIAGVLLLTPGFFTDTIGLLLFVPALRDFAWSVARKRITIVTAEGRREPPRHPPGRGPTIDLDEEEFRRDPDPDSPWRRDRRRDLLDD